MEPVRKRLDRYPSLRFKLDPVSEWTDDLIAELVATGAVDSVDFKGFYKGTVVDQPPDPDLYGRVAEAFPEAWLEDPGLTRRDAARARAAQGPLHVGRPDPFDRRHRGAAVPAADGEREAVAVRRPARAAATHTTGSPSAASAPTVAASSSSGRAVGTSSTWPRSSTRTRRTTSRRPASTSPIRRRDCPSPRSRHRSARRVSAGGNNHDLKRCARNDGGGACAAPAPALMSTPARGGRRRAAIPAC